MRLVLSDLERARDDLMFQLNLEAADCQANKTAAEVNAIASRANFEKHEISATDLTFGPVLGQGGFGTVYSCHWQGTRAAAKCFRIPDGLGKDSIKKRETLVKNFEH